ncbi:GPI mannosyltransferase 2 [Morella rubra]|uniref:GPI mannosyltransferase 2 n=1 Tax=Morella rubra TaxID=262757 RepID=A0A6A1WAD1_9ROSI|nr:GPI mannosyltransferase 2 [Morella rubra]
MASAKTTFPPKPHQTLVLRLAILSRLLLLALILLWRTFLSPYDTSGPLDLNCLTQDQDPEYILFPLVASAIENGVVWDSVYFVRISHCGYEYEQSYAFLPLLPLLMFLLSRSVFAPLVSLVGSRAVLALSGYVINNVAFVLAAIYLYKLSVIILKDAEAAFRASILFCFNPASIFYSSIYSESLYALLSIGGIYHLVTDGNRIAVLWLALSGCTRSNGVLNAGYVCFRTLHRAYDAVFIRKNAYLALQILVSEALRCVSIFAPFIAFQAYGYYNICLGRSLDETRPWCKARVPLLYNYIQSHYWGAGFLTYFQLKQLPNFLLASPILSLALCSVVYYAQSRPEIFFSLGFQASDKEKFSSPVLVSLESIPRSNIAHFPEKPSPKIQEYHNLRHRKHTTREDVNALPLENDSLAKLGYLSVSGLPFILHLAFMAATAFFVMHVQINNNLSIGKELNKISAITL